MKKIIGAVLILLFSVGIRASVLPSVTLAWDANTEPDVIGYNVWIKQGDAYALVDEVDELQLDDPLNPMLTIYGLNPDHKIYLYLTAFTESEESDFSNEACGELDGDRYVPCGSIDPTPPSTDGGSGGSSGGCFISTVNFFLKKS